jgi:DNA polymerase-3 subunit delta
MASELKPAYLIAGTDTGKITETLARLRSRAEREGGAGALEVVPSKDGKSADPEALAAAISAMSLMPTRRYLLAEGVERWTAKGAAAVVEALPALDSETTVVLVAREEPPKVKAPAQVAKAVEKVGGEVLAFEAPKERDLPRHLVAEAKRRGFSLTPPAASLLVHRMGTSTARLATELDRLALWADGAEVGAEDLEPVIADASEEKMWGLADALVERDLAAASIAAERLREQGESAAYVVSGVASRLRQAHEARRRLEAGEGAGEIERTLGMHPYAAKMLLRRLRETSAADLREAIRAIADLEWDTRGGSDHSEEVALTLALRRAGA